MGHQLLLAARLSWLRCFWTREGVNRFEHTSHSETLKREVSILRQVIFFTSITWQCPFEYQNATEQVLLWQRMWKVKHQPRKLTYWAPMWNSMVSEATVPLSDQSYYLPKSAFGRGQGKDVGGQRKREGAIPVISKSSYSRNEGVAMSSLWKNHFWSTVERNLAKASNHSSLSPQCLSWKLSSFQEMSNCGGFWKGEAYTDEGTAVRHDVVSLPAIRSFNMEKSNSFNLANGLKVHEVRSTTCHERVVWSSTLSTQDSAYSHSSSATDSVALGCLAQSPLHAKGE